MAPALSELPPFPGIRKQGLEFLSDLKDEKNQDRDWFNERKPIYTDELRWPMRCLVADVIWKLEGDKSVSLHGDPKKSVFRIYRDVRFSKDKRPYQSHVSCRLTVDPRLQDQDGLVYVHIEPPNNLFLAAGIYQPPVKRLRPIRRQIVERPSLWMDVVARLRKEGLEPESHGDDLKSMPRGFAEYSEDEMAYFLKWTSFLVSENVKPSAVQAPGFADDVAAFARRAWPLLAFIRDSK